MLSHLLKLHGESPDSETVRQMFRTLSMLCRHWFANPRILWLPLAKSDKTRTFITYVRDRLSSVTVAEACHACKLPQRTMQRIAQEEHISETTARDWVRKARELEYLSPGRQGTAGASPGSRLDLFELNDAGLVQWGHNDG